MRKADPVRMMIETINLLVDAPGTRYLIYRKPCDREPFIWESVDGLEEAERKAQWHAQRDVDEYHVYDPRQHRIISKFQQEWQPGLRPSTELAVDSQRI